MERVSYRPLRGAPDVAVLLSSFAVGQILQNGTLLPTGLANKPQLIAFPSPDLLNGVVTIGAITIPKVNVASFAAGIVLLALLTLFVNRTDLGLSMRAAAEDLPAARLMGIKVNRVVATAFAIGSALAAVDPRPAAPGRRLTTDGDRLRRAAGPGLVILLVTIGLAGLEASGQAFWQGLAINLAIFMILTVALNLTSGFTGVFSLGQIG